MGKSTRTPEILNPPDGLRLKTKDGSRTKTVKEYYQIRALLKSDQVTYCQ